MAGREHNFEMFSKYILGAMKGIEEICNVPEMGERDKVDVFYAVYPFAYAKYKTKILNGDDPGPNISVYLKNITYNKDQIMGGYGTLSFQNYDESTITMRAPLIYQLELQVTMLCNNEIEGDLLQAQLLMGMPFNRNYYFKVNNQYACCYVQDPENASSVELGPGKDKISRRTCTLIISRAYLEYPIRSFKSMIKEFNLQYNVITGPVKVKNTDINNLLTGQR